MPCDELVSPVVTYRLPSESKPMPPPMWQQLKTWASYSKIRTSESRSSCLVARSIVKREMRGRDIFETRRSNGSPGGEVFGLKVGKYCM